MAEHSHGSAGHGPDLDIILTGLTILGLAVALLDRFWQPLPAVWPQAGLGLAFLAGGVPAGISALRELFDGPTIEQMLEVIYTKAEEDLMENA